MVDSLVADSLAYRPAVGLSAVNTVSRGDSRRRQEEKTMAPEVTRRRATCFLSTLFLSLLMIQIAAASNTSGPPRSWKPVFFGQRADPAWAAVDTPHRPMHALRTEAWELSVVWTTRQRRRDRRQHLQLDLDSGGYARLGLHAAANSTLRDDAVYAQLCIQPLMGRWTATGRPDAPNQDQHVTVLMNKCWALEAECILCPWGTMPRLVRGVIRNNDRNRRIIGTFEGRGRNMGTTNSSTTAADTLDPMYPHRRLRGYGASGMAF